MIFTLHFFLQRFLIFLYRLCIDNFLSQFCINFLYFRTFWCFFLSCSWIIAILANDLAFIENILSTQDLLLDFISFYEQINIVSNYLFSFIWTCAIIGSFLKCKHLLILHSKILFADLCVVLNCILSCFFIFQLSNHSFTSKFSYYDLTLSTPTITISFYLIIYSKKSIKFVCSTNWMLNEAEIVVSSSKVKSI